MTTVSTTVSAEEIVELRRRLDQLAAEVCELRQTLRAYSDPGAKPWWQAVAGIFDGDPFFEQVVAEGRKWRESQRPKARAKRARS